MPSARSPETLPFNSRVVLMVGFGGLLALMGFSGIDALRALAHIQSSNDRIGAEYLRRTQVLERIRSDLYVSGTYVRDYLLEPESGKAEGHRYSLLESRRDMDSALAEYRGLVNAAEQAPFGVLTRELASYWATLEPVLAWTPEQRRANGYIFLRDEVFPRRQSMLGIADQIGRVNEAQLNAGKVLVAESFRQSERRLVLTIAVAIGLGLLLAAFSVRRILAHESETAAARAELQQLSARLVEAQETERRSISRELHDEVGQALTGVLVEMANLTTLIRGRDHDALARKAVDIKKLVENSIATVRNMALLLRPSMLDDLGLAPALAWQAREVSKRSGVWVEIDAERVPEDLPEEHKTCIYRVTQEALHNIVQHAGARTVKVTVEQEDGRVRLAIRDDGRGFNPQREKGMGLLGIHERVARLGGHFEIESRPGHGTELRVVLPVPALAGERA
jgi:signal transduction histidine kinase